MRSKNINPYLCSIACLFIIIYNLYLLKSYIPAGYSVNLYNQTPEHFLHLLLVVYFFGTILLLRNQHDIFNKIGVFILLLNYGIFLLLLNQLGYYVFSRHDDISYLAQIDTIIREGQINIDDIYPATHILYAQVSLLTGVKSSTLATLMPVFFSYIFVVGLLVLSRVIIKNRSVLYLLIPVSLIYYLRFMHFSLAPHYNFFVIMPILMLALHYYLHTGKDRLGWTICMQPVLLVIPIGHPFINIFAIYILIVLLFIKSRFNTNMQSPSNLIMILIGATFAWFVRSVYLLKGFGQYYAAFVQHGISSVAGQGANYFEKANSLVSPYSLLETMVLLYGRYIFPMLIIFFSFIIVITDKKNRIPLNKEFKIIVLSFIGFSMIDGFFILNPIFSHTVQRVTTLNYFVFPLVPLFALSLHVLFCNKSQVARSSITATILALIYGISVYGALPSPGIYASNSATVYNEVEGMRWVFDKKGNEPIATVLDPQAASRFCDLFFGWTEKRSRVDVNRYFIPDHFGYREFGQIMPKDYYILIMGWGEREYVDVLRYTKNRDILTRYEPEDFSRFRNDPDVLKIYESLNIEVYKS